MPSYPRIRVLLSTLLLLTATAAAAAGYPAALEQEVPPPPKAQLDSATEYGNDTSAILNVKGSVEQVAKYYRDRLPGKGWTLSADIALGTAHALEFTRGGSSIAISIMSTDTGVTAVVTLSR